MLMAHPLDPMLRRHHGRGLSQRDVAERLGVSQRWVHLRMRALGLAPNGYGSAASRAKRASAAASVHRLRRLRRERAEAAGEWWR